MTQPPRKKAVAYLRISSERQRDNESVATQRDAIIRNAEQDNIEIVEWFEDIAKSGKNADRDGLQELMAFCIQHKGKIDYWIVYNMKRASRDIDTYSSEVRIVLKALGINIRSATEPAVNDTKEGRFMENLLVLLGQLDNEGKSEVTKDNMRSLALQGYWQHPPILGYDTHKIPNDLGKLRPTLKPNSMAPFVKKVLERFSQGDITKAELTRYAADVGLRSRYGKKLGEESIHRLIKHPVYAGYVSDNLTDNQLVEGRHQAIIGREVYELNQALVYGNKKRVGEIHRKFNPDYPLKGLLLCSNCKLPLYASAPRTGAGGTSPRYHCSRRSCKGLSPSVKASVVHKDFEGLLKRIQPDEKVLELYKGVLIMEAARQLGGLNDKIGGIRRKLDTVADNRLSVIKKFSTDRLTEAEKDELVAALDEEKSAYQVELEALEKQQAVRESDIKAAVDAMRKVQQQWDLASIQSKVRFQDILFPGGLVYNSATHKFGTSGISPLYSVVGIEKTSREVSKSYLVAEVGLEPTTSWL